MQTRVVFIILLAMVLAACQTQTTTAPPASQGEPPTAPPVSQGEPPTSLETSQGAVPEVDTSLHIVPLSEIYFDTFRPGPNRTVPLDEASPALIRDLHDAIPPIYEPVFETATDSNAWLGDDDIVLGYADGDEAYAYAIKILNWHEMVSHEVNGRPILTTY